jgi:two-component sensor histidine kinase
VRQIVQIACETLGFRDWGKTRVVTAALEMSRNAVSHGGGGKLALELGACEHSPKLVLRADDQGPGIPSGFLDFALGDSANHGGRPEGLGLGLRGIRRLADHFDIDTGPGGTSVEAAFDVPGQGDAAALAGKVGEALAGADRTDRATALAEQNKELLQAVADRELMLRELHHRTQNNLALISSMVQLRARGSSDDAVRQALDDIAARIRSIGSVYARLQTTSDIEKMELKPFIAEALEQTSEALAVGQDIRIAINGPDLDIHTTQAVDVALLLNELLTNAIKHAFANHPEPKLEVDIAEDGDFLCLTVRDNGPGLEKGLAEPSRDNSLGWKVVRSIIMKYDGKLSVHSDEGLEVSASLKRQR